ncbi:MAG: glycosyltransferase [Armatimonadota bacterium]|nr:glycosyltransferase [Armatimonadota bacterium]
MRIALFTNTYLPTLNGVAIATDLYRRGLAERGHEVHVFAPAARGEDPFANDPSVHRYPSALMPGEVDYMVALPPPFSLRVSQELGGMQLDLVHTQHPWWVGAWGKNWARRRGLPVVSTAHTQYEQYADRIPLPDAWVEGAMVSHVTRYFNDCDVISTSANWMRQKLIDGHVRTPVELVRNPVDLSGLREPHREQTRARLGFDDDALVVGYLGRISPEKQLERVADAVAMLAEERAGARLLIVGDGSATDALREYAAARLGDRAVFTGAVPHGEVAHYHAAMDVFATASRSETQPLAYTEAMYVGTPVVALATPRAADMIADGDNGLLVEPDLGARGIAAAIERVLVDSDLTQRLRRGGRHFAESCHYPAVAERLEEVYALAVERNQARLRA